MKFEFEKRIEYIFDGWNVILEKEYDLSNTVTDSRKRYWGLDLSGSTQGAGGVGGLLVTFATKSSPATAGTETHYYHYDANGNVTETVDSNGDLTASYEYGPFGELVSEIGTYAQENTYKFSTKPQDAETGHYYYGFRWYDAGSGRWLNRDPIEEEGGYNLYAFINNDGINKWDSLGLWANWFSTDWAWKQAKRALGIGAIINSAVKCYNSLKDLANPPECVKDSNAQGQWQEKCRGDVKGAISSCIGTVTGVIQAAARGLPAGVAAAIVDYAVNLVVDRIPDNLIDGAICDSRKPKVDPCCNE